MSQGHSQGAAAPGPAGPSQPTQPGWTGCGGPFLPAGGMPAAGSGLNGAQHEVLAFPPSQTDSVLALDGCYPDGGLGEPKSRRQDSAF